MKRFLIWDFIEKELIFNQRHLVLSLKKFQSFDWHKSSNGLVFIFY